MEFKFTPIRLINAKNEIVKRHGKVLNSKFVYTDKEKRLISMVVGWKREQIPVKYLILTRDELIYIASYIPYNVDKVDMTNLFEVLRNALDDTLSQVLFTQWHYSYKNKECNEYMSSLLAEFPVFRTVFVNHNYDIDKIQEVLKSNNILRDYGKKIILGISKNTIEDRLEYYGVGPNSMLYGECVRYFYIFCEAKDYIENHDKLLRSVSTYDDERKREFLINFISELSHKDLAEFKELSDFCTSGITGNIDTNKYKRFFKDVPDNLEKKYRNWINSCRIAEFFGTDERSTFWKKYSFVSVQKNAKHGLIILECRNFYITEFLGKAMGAMYVYDKKFFQETVVRWLAIYNTVELKSHMYRNEKLAERRLVHLPQPGWQYEFKSYILRHQITDTLY